MGYNTNFSLKWKDNGPEKQTPKIREFLKENADTYYGINEFGQGEESCKWYDYDEDMKALSKTFPTVIFTLHGEGEESGDIWNNYYYGGKSQRAQVRMTFDEFDESKLK